LLMPLLLDCQNIQFLGKLPHDFEQHPRLTFELCLGKLNIRIDNNYPHRFEGSWAATRLRGRLDTVDPWNLIQIMLAEGMI
jgi:hypothetical protein